MNKEKLKVQLEIIKEADPNANLSVLAMCHILETLLEEDKEEVKVKEKPQHKPQHKPTKENLGFELRYNGIIVKPLYLAFAFKAYKNNNWFPTRELAEKERDKRQAIARVKEYITENNLNITVKCEVDVDVDITIDKSYKFQKDCKEDLEIIYK